MKAMIVEKFGNAKEMVVEAEREEVVVRREEGVEELLAPLPKDDVMVKGKLGRVHGLSFQTCNSGLCHRRL